MKRISVFFVIAIAVLAVTVSCNTDSSISPVVADAPLPMEDVSQETGQEAVSFYDDISDQEFTSKVLPQVNVERLENGLAQAASCDVVAVFKGKSTYLASDNSLGLLAKKGKGFVSAPSRSTNGDLVFAWFPVSLSGKKKATLAAGICR
jgi:hypothetical protein